MELNQEQQADPPFLEHLRRWGPDRASSEIPSLHASETYCRRLACSHYENFPVVTRLLPRDLRQHFANVYAWCRWADDLSDELGSTEQSLRLLNWWRTSLDQSFSAPPEHPVLIALQATINEYGIPRDPFHHLIDAFEQDQRVTGYTDFAQLRDYCRGSADPVGRIVLYLCRCFTEENARDSDSICTGLQLANFWQDVARDADIGRRYLPANDCRDHGYSIADWNQRITNRAFLQLMSFQVNRAEEMIRAGLPLISRVPSRVQLTIDLFARGGLCILDRIRQIDHQVWTQRPVVRKRDLFRLIGQASIAHGTRFFRVRHNHSPAQTIPPQRDRSRGEALNE